MKDNTFIIIGLLVLMVIYLGDNVVLKRSNELLLLDSINTLNEQRNELKTSYFELEQTAMDLSDICDRFQSSRNAKEEYFKNK